MKSVIALAFLGFASAACPNACSGHGTCNSLDQCTCYKESTEETSADLWRGADCSLMTCPRGTSWTQNLWNNGVLSPNLHKTDVECSDGGTCDTSTGECTCFPGFEGSACQRTVCPNDCSGHGTCRSNQDFAVDFSEAVFKEQKEQSSTAASTSSSNNLDVTSYYDYFLVTYDDAWDAGMQYGCLCDIGFRGVDCSEIECPTTYDAMDKESCTKYGEWEEKGTYAYNFKDGASPSLTTFQGNTVLIREWNDVGLHQNTADASNVRPNTFRVVAYNPIEEYPCNGAPAGDYCSGRGKCDTSSGICQCFRGFTGPACEEVADIF